MRCQGISLIPILELRCIISFNKWSFCSGGGSGARLGDDAGQPLAALAMMMPAIFSEKTIREVREMVRKKRKGDALLELANKKKSKPSQPDAAIGAKPAAIGAASSSGSQEVAQTASAPEPLLRPFDRNSNKEQLIELANPVTDRNVVNAGHNLFDLIRATKDSWSDEVGLHRASWPTSMVPIGVDTDAYNKATPPFNR